MVRESVAGHSTHQVELKFEYSPNFPVILEQLHSSLLISTYQAGQLISVGTQNGQLVFSFSQFEQAMGIAVSPSKIAVATKRQIWFLKSATELAAQVAPPGKYDNCFLARGCHHTGSILGHELIWARDELWIVNTLFSCLCTLSAEFNFVPRWRPPFISKLAAEDRCHLNGVCMKDGQPAYVTVLAESDGPNGWRSADSNAGAVIECASGQTIARGLHMPHSPRWHDGKLWLLDSGCGQLIHVDPMSAEKSVVVTLDGYTRGLALHGDYAFVGLSRIRESAVFGRVPISSRQSDLKCGVNIVDVARGEIIANLDFHSGVQEIFDVQLLTNSKCPYLSGPLADADGKSEVWLVPTQ